MAQELRQELLVDVVADGTTAANAGAEFRNDSSRTLHIRGLDIEANQLTAGIDEWGDIEVSKAPVYQGDTNNSPFFRKSVAVQQRGGVGDSGSQHKMGWRWGKGQLTLEPNESLFMNTKKTSGGQVTGKADIEYEF